MALKEDHDLLDLFLLLPGLCDHGDPFWADTFNFGKTVRGFLYDVQGLHSKFLDDSFCHDGTDAFDQARTEVFLYAMDCSRNSDFVILNLKLLAKFLIVNPPPC